MRIGITPVLALLATVSPTFKFSVASTRSQATCFSIFSQLILLVQWQLPSLHLHGGKLDEDSAYTRKPALA